ncbi:MAG: cysteine--tRNA ligase [bacterium]|nr:cysteine--tRNA ligase [bacterium]
MLKIYNTPNRKIEEFKPLDAQNVKIYTCGPTVYATPHIGNWAAFIYWDILVRTLEANGFGVNRTMNITDVGHLVSDEDEGEDKLEKGARREGKTAWQVAEFYTAEFLSGFSKLNLIQPQHISKATDFIEEQIAIIEELSKKGLTYETSDGIYFDTAKFPRYADFAHLDLEKLKAGARVNFNPEKRNLADFALWKWSPEGKKRDMEWMYRGKAGFPGWHLECSAIAINTLGATLDIHTGGIDHIPVHHTDEIAQSESFTGEKFSNYWLHANFLTSEGKKISKSLENGFTLADLEARGFSPLDFKMLILQSHYQSGGDFTFESLQAAQNRLKNWRNIAAIRWQIAGQNAGEIPSLASKKALLEIINHNLDTPKTLSKIDEIFTEISKTAPNKLSKTNLQNLLEFIDDLLGLDLLNSTPDISEEAKRQILERREARENKDWAQSDKIRDELLKAGIILRDTPAKTFWEYSR